MDEVFWTAVAAVVAAVALALSIVNFFATRERTIGWSAEQSQVYENRRGHYRMRNDSRGLRARVLRVEDNFVGENGESMTFKLPTLPAIVEPGNWMPVSAHQILGQEPLALTIYWQQAKLGSDAFKRKTHSAKIYM